MSDLEKKIIIPVEADPKKADEQINKFKKDILKETPQIPISVDLSDITKALNSLQGMIGKIEKAFDKDIKFSGLQKSLDDVYDKIDGIIKTTKKGSSYINVNPLGFDEMKENISVITQNIESLNDTKISFESFEKLAKVLENIETLINSIVKGMNFDAIRPSTQVQEDIDSTTEKLEKLVKTEEKIGKLEKYLKGTGVNQGKNIIEFGDSNEIKESTLENMINKMKEYISLGGDLSEIKFKAFNMETQTRELYSLIDVLDILEDEQKIDFIDDGKFSDDISTIRVLRQELFELNKELNDAKNRENRDLNVSLDTKSVEDFTKAITEAVSAVGKLDINIPEGFTFDGLSVENLNEIITRIDKIVAAIENLGRLLTGGIDFSNLQTDINKNLKEKPSVDVDINPKFDSSDFIKKIETQLLEYGEKVNVNLKITDGQDDSDNDAKPDEFINDETITGIKATFKDITDDFGFNLSSEISGIKDNLGDVLVQIDYDKLFSDLRNTLLQIVTEFQNSLQAVGLSSSQLDEAYKTIKGWNDADSHSSKSANVTNGERGAFLNSKTGTISNSFFVDAQGSFRDTLFNAIKELSIGLDREISSIYDTWIHSHPFRKSIEGLKAIGSDIGFSVADLELGVEKLLKDKLPNMLLTNNYKFTNLDLSGVSEEITEKFIKEYKKELLKAGLEEATVEGKTKIVFPNKLAKRNGVYDLDEKSRILNSAMSNALSNVGLEKSRLTTGNIEDLKVDLSVLQKEEKQTITETQRLIEVLEHLNKAFDNIGDGFKFGISEESINNIIEKITEAINKINSLNTKNLNDNVGFVNNASDIGTTGMSDEISLAENLKKKILEVANAVDEKTNAFRQEEQVVIGTVQREISNLEYLDGQLTEIIYTLEKIQKIPINLDLKFGGDENADDKLTKLLSELEEKVKNLDIESFSKFVSELKNLNVPKNSAENLEMVAIALKEFRTSISGISKEENEFLLSISKIISKTDELKNLVKVLESSSKKIKNAGKSVKDNSEEKDNGSKSKDKSKSIKNAIQETSDAMARLKSIGSYDAFSGLFENKSKEVDKLNQELKEGQITLSQYKNKVKEIKDELNKNKDVVKFIEPNDLKSAKAEMESYARTISNNNSTLKKTNAIGDKVTYSWIDQNKMVHTLTLSYNDFNGALLQTHTMQKQAEKQSKSFSETLIQGWQNVKQYVLSFVGFYEIINAIRQGITVVRDLDTALTEMRKVSDETTQSLKNFQDVSFDIAKSVGTTAQQIQNSTADFMRLGESLEDAAKSAEVANILLNVSEFESIDEATESLVSMSAAYDELDKIDIVDKLNLIGNNFAISTDGLATALQKSASALKTAGNDIDEAIALATASNRVVQDPDSVGAGIRTISLRITGTEAAKEELSSLGEDVDDFVVTTTSKLNEQVKDLTKTVGKDGISLLDDNGNYRSTYKILQDIADVWEKIAEEDLKTGQNRQNALLELLAGKNRSNILASILQSPDVLRDAYQSSVNDSAGSAEKELAAYLDSIEGKISQFQNEVQEFWYNLISSETVKGVIDFGTKFMDILGDIVDYLGEIGTVGVSAFAFLGTKKILSGKDSGGRVKKFTLII